MDKKTLATLAAVLALSAGAVYNELKPATIDDVVKEVIYQETTSCQGALEMDENHILFCRYGKQYSITAKELQALGDKEQAEQRLSDLMGCEYDLLFDFESGKFLVEQGGYIKHCQ